MIKFNVPTFLGNEIKYIKTAIENEKICGDGEFTKKCSSFFEKTLNAKKVLLTTSCTHALEMAASLIDIQPGDEIIMPSFTFVSTADAFVTRGAKIVFIDINPKTMNIDENLIESAITKKTKAIVPVHYAGVACNMDKICEIAKKNKIWLIEDAAQGVNSYYNGKPLGTIGDFGCYSFHETKNYTMGEGGALIIQNSEKIEMAEIIREKGTDRSKFFRGEVDKYTWVEWGSSYLPSDINAAYLYAQLENYNLINNDRLNSWNTYFTLLKELEAKNKIELPYIPKECTHNAHMFYIKVKNINERKKLIDFLKSCGILSVFHYIPLHSAPAGIKYGKFHGVDVYTTKESERLLRLPLYFGLQKKDILYICDMIISFYQSEERLYEN